MATDHKRCARCSQPCERVCGCRNAGASCTRVLWVECTVLVSWRLAWAPHPQPYISDPRGHILRRKYVIFETFDDTTSFWFKNNLGESFAMCTYRAPGLLYSWTAPYQCSRSWHVIFSSQVRSIPASCQHLGLNEFLKRSLDTNPLDALEAQDICKCWLRIPMFGGHSASANDCLVWTHRGKPLTSACLVIWCKVRFPYTIECLYLGFILFFTTCFAAHSCFASLLVVLSSSMEIVQNRFPHSPFALDKEAGVKLVRAKVCPVP